jgi:hypothetical protein
MMRSVTPLIALAFAVLASAFPADAAVDARSAGACGRPGAPPCPLQRWMREHSAVAYANRDSAGLATVLEQAASLNPAPERWRKWGTVALAGASRVRRGSPGAALSACVGCHDTYRAEYVKNYRTRRLPAK